VNAVLEALGPLTRFGRRLSADGLEREAQRKTGLRDFGSASYRDGLVRLVDSLNAEARLTPIGRLIAREEILTALGNRLQLVEHHRAHPEIGARPIERPVIIIGMGRSGTTILHELMALDPDNRVPATWEVDMPFPPPETATYRSDPRIEAIQSRLDRTDQIVPEFKKIHRMGATLPQECVRWTTGELTSLIFGISYEVPSYGRWLLREADFTATYDYHRRFLQLLQWKHFAKRWVLKSPGHLWSLREMLAEYPDARLIQTHRDPLKTTASLSSLVTQLRIMATDHVDPPAIARQWARWNADGLNKSVEARASGLIRPEQILDVSFYEFMEDPLSQMQRIYGFLGHELAAETARTMQRYLDARPADEHGTHRYRFADFGLDVDEERERLRPYLEAFDVPSEPL
jgi:hypothetical protein